MVDFSLSFKCFLPNWFQSPILNYFALHESSDLRIQAMWVFDLHPNSWIIITIFQQIRLGLGILGDSIGCLRLRVRMVPFHTCFLQDFGH